MLGLWKKMGDGGPLWEILEHIRKQLRMKKVRLKRIQTGRTEPYRGEVETLPGNIAQWARWEKAIVEAMNSNDATKR